MIVRFEQCWESVVPESLFRDAVDARSCVERVFDFCEKLTS